MSEYVTVYEYEISSILHFILPLVFFAVAGPIVAMVAISRIRRSGWRLRAGMMLLWGVGTAVGGGLGVAIVLWRHVEAVRSFETNDYEIVEGAVRVLRMQPTGGHAPGDLVTVGGRELEIDFFGEVGPGYRQTIARGGVLRDGQQARLYVHKGKVLRVDIVE